MSDDAIPNDALEMLPDFLQESEEHLQVLNEKMLEAEKVIKSGNCMSKDDLNTMFRAAHTIKGTASFIGLTKVVALTHKSETLLQKLRDGEMSLTDKIADVLFAAFDKLNSLLDSLREHKTEGVEINDEVQKIEGVLQTSPSAKPAEAPSAPPSPPPVASPAPIKSDDGGGINEKYLEQFIGEALQNIDDLNNLLVSCEQQAQNSQIVHDIFRFMHTLKGSAGIVNAKAISELAHRMESILDLYRSKNLSLPGEITAVLFKGLDALKAMTDSLTKERRINFDASVIEKELEECARKTAMSIQNVHPPVAAVAPPVAAAVTPPPQIEETGADWSTLQAKERGALKEEVELGHDVYLIEAVISSKETIKSMRLAMIIERLNKSGRVIAFSPSYDDLDKTKLDAVIHVLYCSNVNENNIREILAMDSLNMRMVEKAEARFVQTLIGDPIMEKDNVPQQSDAVDKQSSAMAVLSSDAGQQPKDAKTTAPIEISTVKIDARKLDKLMNLSGELVIIRSQYARLSGLLNNDLIRQKDIMRFTEQSTALMSDLDKEMAVCSASPVKDLTRLQKMLDELKSSIQVVSVQVSHEEFFNNIHALSETTSALEKTASDLQAGVMQTRMVPVEGVFSRFKRIIRDISKDLNKEVVLKIEGAETELDKKIVDGLGDPLTHMIRNAVDHGLEDGPTRQKNGKSPIGTILLKASHKGNSMCIEVSDDGKGMDPQKIADIAVRKGIISPDQAAKMSDKEKLNLIFLAGFSTAEKVTGLSGRGVGMDVVRSMITSFNGVVDIHTVLGKGSTFVLKIPLTLAIIQALLVVIGGEVYAFPLDAVTEIIKVPSKDIYSVDGNVTVKLRDHALSLIELNKVIRVKPNKSEEEHKRVVIITDGENKLGVLVDSLVGKDEIVIKSFTKHFSRVKGVIGASILADGSIALILDPATIIKESR